MIIRSIIKDISNVIYLDHIRPAITGLSILAAELQPAGERDVHK
jgi:hypothetical protein